MTAPSTMVARVLRAVKVRSTPDTSGHVVGTVYARTRTEDTWVPVLAQVPGFVQVRFLAGKNVRTGWVPANTVNAGYDTFGWVEIELAAKTLTVHYAAGKPARTWPLKAVGGGRYPTPLGTFWTERVGDADANSVYGDGPFVETSARSKTYLEAPIIAVHSWHRKLAVGEQSHGCARAPDDAVRAVADLPLGAPVVIRP